MQWVLMMGRSQREALVDGELDEFRIAFETKLLHDAVFVKSHGAGRDAQHACGFLHREPLGQQLQHLALAECEFA